METLPWSDFLLRATFVALILSHFFSVMIRLIKQSAVCANLLTASCTTIGFAVQTVARAFKTFPRAAGLVSVAQLMARYKWFHHDHGDSMVLGSCVDSYVPLIRRTSL